MSGKSNPRYYEKILVKYNNCGKEFYRKPSGIKRKNKDGFNHNFCCKECYYTFRKYFYVGDKLYNTGKKMDKDFCNKVRMATLRQYEKGAINRQTKPQRLINELLDKNNITYQNEKIFGYYAVDNYLNDSNLIIEVMGDYFHSNPIIYNDKQSLNDMQLKDINRDKRKHTYIAKYHNIEILYLWEDDIKKNIKLCEKLILKYVKNKGKLDDYNSFNFYLVNGEIEIKNNIINPYF